MTSEQLEELKARLPDLLAAAEREAKMRAALEFVDEKIGHFAKAPPNDQLLVVSLFGEIARKVKEALVDSAVMRQERTDGDIDEVVPAEFARQLERHARALAAALTSAADTTAYSSHDDTVGYRVCCQVQSYLPHASECVAKNALRDWTAFCEEKLK